MGRPVYTGRAGKASFGNRSGEGTWGRTASALLVQSPLEPCVAGEDGRQPPHPAACSHGHHHNMIKQLSFIGLPCCLGTVQAPHAHAPVSSSCQPGICVLRSSVYRWGP